MKSNYCYLLILLITIFSCARRGTPIGGDKDENAPIIISAKPNHNSTNFTAKEIRINFDEYIKLKNVQKQLIISPPLKYNPIISPLGLPSKRITIKILDTLKENTTYVFNFGESIEDHNEGNKLSNFKYVFSTGNHIDSLKINGFIKDAFLNKVDNYVSVMLYEMNETYNDSIIFKEKPTYIANTLDSIAWEITNIKKGKYRIIALKENDNDYIYNPKNDKIAFIDSIINIPTENNFILNLFKQTPNFELTRPKENSKGHLILGFKGKAENLKVKAIDLFKNDKKNNFKSVSFFDKQKDTLHYYFKGKDLDSIKLQFTNTNFIEDKIIKLRLKKLDSLVLKSNVKGTLIVRDTMTITSNNPLNSKIDQTKIRLIDKDSVTVNFTAKIEKLQNLKILFNRQPDNNYKLKILPNAFTDFFEQTNDTLNYNFRTKKESYYGSLALKVESKNYPIIVQLLSQNLELIEEIIATKPQEFNFESLVPSKYIIRVINDHNKNNTWDTGNFINNIQPEKVSYFDKTIEIRENFYINETFILE